MTIEVSINGKKDFFYLALEDRLIRAGASIVDFPSYKTIKIGIDTDDDSDIMIVPGLNTNTRSRVIISIYDLLIPNGKNKWGSNIIYEWLEYVKNDNQPPFNTEEAHYWVNIRDAVEAIVMLLLSDTFNDINGHLHLCGRRAWFNDSVFEELEMLWLRYTNTINYSHTVESLSRIPNPVKENRINNRLRPDLTFLNKVMLRAGGDGWHPPTPLRTGLMELLAQNL